MINRTSRYYDGPLAQLQDKSSNQYELSVFRKFPTDHPITYVTYVWKERDEIARVADWFKLNPRFWWKIADINPEILDVFDIAPGTTIRIPYGS